MRMKASTMGILAFYLDVY